MSRASVTIEKLSFGGAGFGRCNGKACFVPLTAPGDVAIIDISSEKRSFITGSLRELTVPSPVRTVPPCPVFGQCGGCHWQHIPYDLQLAQKQQIFTELLGRIGRVGKELIEEIVPAPSSWEYRSRVQLKVRVAAGEVHMGFYRTGSHFVIDLPGRCAISRPLINTLFAEFHSFMDLFPEPDKIPQIDIATGDGDESIVVIHYIGSNREQVVQYLGENRHRLPSASGIWLQSGRKNSLTHVWGIAELRYSVQAPPTSEESFRLKFSRGGFSQVNGEQNKALIEVVREWAELTGKERVLDLYCGNGNFSLPLAPAAAEIVGIEDYEPSIRDAVANAQANGISNATYACADAAAAVSRLAARGEHFDLVILDPPRTGAKEVAGLVRSVEAARIIYISCDPATLARDIAIMRKTGYEVVKSRPLDMFPQTYHLESITLLKRTL